MAAKKKAKSKTGKKAPAKKPASPRKKAPGKKKPAIKKAPAKKSTTQKPAGKKSAVKKAAAKKAVARKPAASAVKKIAAKKPVAPTRIVIAPAVSRPAPQPAALLKPAPQSPAAKPPAKPKAVVSLSAVAIPPKELLQKKPVPAKVPEHDPQPGEDPIGIVTHYYNHLSVAVVRLDNGSLAVGDVVRFLGHTTDLRQTIDSIEVNHHSVTEAGRRLEFGVKVKDHVREHDVVYKVNEL